MVDSVWADISEFQSPVDDAYPCQILSIRSNDGTYRDRNFVQNLAWCKAAVASGRMECFIVYLVFRTNWQDDLNTFISNVGTPDPKMIVMIDVESWGGQITGDQSAPITALRNGIGAWIGANARIGVYANRGDLTTLYPGLPGDIRVFVAGYGTVIQGYPQEVAQQYTDAGPCLPFGTCDMNIARGLSPADVAAQFGIGGSPALILGDDNMQLIQSPGRGIALIGPNFFRELTDDEEVNAAITLSVKPVMIGNDRQFDLWRSLADPTGMANVLAGVMAVVNNDANIDSETRNLVLDPKVGILFHIGLLQGQVAALQTALAGVATGGGAPLDMTPLTEAAKAGAIAGIASLKLAAITA